METYDGLSEFRDKLARQLQITLNTNDYVKSLVAESLAGTVPVAVLATTSSRTPSIPSLSDEAQTVLIEAAQDPSGIVLKMKVMGGTIVQTNGKGFAELGNARSSALWEAAVDELVSNDLLKPEGYKGEVFAITHEGFRVVDLLKIKN